MSGESEVGKREIENMVLDQVLDALPIITGRTVTNEWDGVAEQVEGSPDHIIGVDHKPFGVELTQISGADEAWDYVAEAYRLGSKKSDSYSRRGIFRFPIALVMYSTSPPLFEIKRALEEAGIPARFRRFGVLRSVGR